MANYFEDCQKCVPPTRHPGCHDHCPEYLASKAKYDQKRMDARQDRLVTSYVKMSIMTARDVNNKRLKGNRRYQHGGRRD